MKIVFTYHAEYRIKRRSLAKQEVIDAVKRLDSTRKKHGKYFYRKKLKRGEFEVVCKRTERHIKVLTVVWV